MGTIGPFSPEKLITGVLVGPGRDPGPVIKAMEHHFGPTDYRSRFIDFTFTDYYNEEMGEGIRRSFLSFEELVDPATLPDIKIRTNEIEKEFTEGGKRAVNLDPGLLDLDRLILATTKKSPHRIPLRKGIYGEVTLMYRNKRFHPLERTYPDFRTEQYHEILGEIREIYKKSFKL